MKNPETGNKTERRTNGWGIDLNYKDALDNWHETQEPTLKALLSAMGAAPESHGPERDHSILFVRQGQPKSIEADGRIVLESGGELAAAGTLPADLPTGYHQLWLKGAEVPISLVVSPAKCWMPQDLSTWGWAVQLYAARSKQSWGIGDFADLEKLARWSAEELGAGMLLVNPLSSATPILPQQTSPYYPTSRIFLNPLWLHIEWIENAASAALPTLEELGKAGRALNQSEKIERDQIFVLKMKALEVLWSHFAGDERFEAFLRDRGEELESYGTFCALAQKFQSGWHSWPEEFQHPGASAVTEFRETNADRVRFHQWIQWQVDLQLSRCSQHVALMQDLPIGVDPDGADAWAWQDYFACEVGVGAPPDEFNTQGQSWGLPPFVPHKLRAGGYRPFIETIRAAFRHGGGLRIDHVMGLFRLFWVPGTMSAKQGAYVRYDPDEMLAIVALESERARAYVVGEDLGTVEDEARAKLADWGVMSYRLLWFEKEGPAEYPKAALAAVTTHDLPTIAGVWTKADLEKQKRLGLKPNEAGFHEIRNRVSALTRLKDDAPLHEVIVATYSGLSKAPCRILTAAFDDVAMATDRPNIPATMGDVNPNWSIPLPLPLEELMQSQLAKEIARSLSRG